MKALKSIFNWKSIGKALLHFAIFTVVLGLGAEFMLYGGMHGDMGISHALADMSIEFTKPVMAWADSAIGESGMDSFRGFLKSIHEFFGITDTFNETVLDSPIAGLENNHVPSRSTPSVPSSTVGGDAPNLEFSGFE